MSFQVGLQMKLPFATYNFASKPWGSVQPHVLLENATQLECLATLFTSMRPLNLLVFWIILGDNQLLGTFITMFVASLHLDFDGHLLELFLILDIFLLVSSLRGGGLKWGGLEGGGGGQGGEEVHQQAGGRQAVRPGARCQLLLEGSTKVP